MLLARVHKQPLAPKPPRDLGPIQRKVAKGPDVKKPQAEVPKEPVKETPAKKPKVLRKPLKRKWLQKEEVKPTPPRKPSLEIFSDGKHAFKDKDLL